MVILEGKMKFDMTAGFSKNEEKKSYFITKRSICVSDPSHNLSQVVKRTFRECILYFWCRDEERIICPVCHSEPESMTSIYIHKGIS